MVHLRIIISINIIPDFPQFYNPFQKKIPPVLCRRDNFNYSSSSFLLERVIYAAAAARTARVNAVPTPFTPVLGGDCFLFVVVVLAGAFVADVVVVFVLSDSSP